MSYDGSGYPDGLKGDHIPLLARIIAVAESYDALTTFVPNQANPSKSPETVEEILSRGANLQWDGRVIEAFFRCRERIQAIHQRGFEESISETSDHGAGDAYPPRPSDLNGSDSSSSPQRIARVGNLSRSLESTDGRV